MPSVARREVSATLRLAAPLVLVQLAQMSTSVVDVVMVGRLGTAAMAAAVLGSTVYFTLALVAVGVLVAVQPIVAQATGAGDPGGAARAVGNGMWVAVLLSAPLVLGLGFAEPALLALGQAPETAAVAADYLAAIRWGMLPNLWFTAFRGFFEGVARPRPVLAVMLGGVAVNVGLNYVLIYGALGAPALGVVGAGWASAVSQGAICVALGLWLARGGLRHYRVFAGTSRPDPAGMRALVRLGWPIGVNFGLEGGLFTAATLLMGRLGETALAAHQVALNAASVSFMVPLGIGMAGGIRVGQAAGAGDWAAASRAGRTSVALGAGAMLGPALLFWLRPEWVVWAYTGRSPDPDVAALAATLLGIAAVFQIFDGTQAAAAGALRGLKDTRVPMLLAAVSYWGVGLSAGAVLGLWRGGGAAGLWLGLTAGLGVAAVLMTARFLHTVGRRAARATGAAVDGGTAMPPSTSQTA